MLHAHYTFSKSVSSIIRQAVAKAPESLRYEHNAWKLLVKTTPIQKTSRQ